MRNKDGGIFVGPEDGNNLTNPIGGGMVVKVRDEDTAGAYSVHDNTIPPGSPGPRPHLHRDHEEAFYVLEGELTVRVGTRTIKAPAGSFVVVPRGVVHQPSNPGAEPSRVLLVFSPGGWTASSRRRPRGTCRCKQCPTIRRSRRSLKPSPRSTATSSRSSRRSRRRASRTRPSTSHCCWPCEAGIARSKEVTRRVRGGGVSRPPSEPVGKGLPLSTHLPREGEAQSRGGAPRPVGGPGRRGR